MKPAPKGGMTEILTVSQVARLAGWSQRRMLRHLQALNQELGGLLLVNAARGPKRPLWTVSLASLRFVRSAWFRDPEALDDLQAQVERNAARLEQLMGENAALRQRVSQLEKQDRSRGVQR